MRTLSFVASGLAMIVSSISLAWSIRTTTGRGRHAAKPKPPEHKTYNLEPIDSLTVAVSCADCPGLAPLAVGQITDWSMIAEHHYREVSNG